MIVTDRPRVDHGVTDRTSWIASSEPRLLQAGDHDGAVIRHRGDIDLENGPGWWSRSPVILSLDR